MSASFWAGVREAQGQLIERLASILEEWRTTGEEPEIVGALSSGERAAIFLASNEEHRLDSPLVAFLMLEDSLQKWILTERGMKSFIGTVVGGEGL